MVERDPDRPGGVVWRLLPRLVDFVGVDDLDVVVVVGGLGGLRRFVLVVCGPFGEDQQLNAGGYCGGAREDHQRRGQGPAAVLTAQQPDHELD